MSTIHEQKIDVSTQALDLLGLPLHGSRLIEASAGTGKTFTIAMLYVRLVLGHGGEAAYRTALDPQAILVATFTNAATKELHSRIHARLVDAAICFEAAAENIVSRTVGEDVLHDLRHTYAPEDWQACARRLRRAANAMDDAAVSTIHGWCQRMLREHAFETGSLFVSGVQVDRKALTAEAVRDYWRSHIALLDAACARELNEWWKEPKALQKSLQAPLANIDALAPGGVHAPQMAFAQSTANRTQRWAEVKKPWVKWTSELASLLAAAKLEGRINSPHNHLRWLQTLATWANGNEHALPTLGVGWARLTKTGFAELWKGSVPPTHPALDAIEVLHALDPRFGTAYDEILRHAAKWVQDYLNKETTRRAENSHDDLLRNLDAALQGPNGTSLAARIRTQFPVAMIDEFQDTDPVQYRILNTIYCVGENDSATALILIGDPKQAIYSFRSADIYTYLQARAEMDGRLYTLRTNFRSTKAVVAASNHCFGLAEQRTAGSAAFLFRNEAGNPVPFIEVEANGLTHALHLGDKPAAPLTAWWVLPEEGELFSAADHIARLSDACAHEIASILAPHAATSGRLKSLSDSRPVRAEDIAVLVNNGDEAAGVRNALNRYGIRSVYLSEDESVLDTLHAKDVRHWLAACAEPSNSSLLRNALATRTLSLHPYELDRLNQDEAEWDRLSAQFHAYQACWRKQGVLPMLRRLINEFELPSKLLDQDHSADGIDSERILTDLLHIAELLQQASLRIGSEQGLIRYLAEGSASSSDLEDVQRQRLESDATLVQIITIHKSKGMEYPLVFVPFTSSCRPIIAQVKDKKNPPNIKTPFVWHDEFGKRHLSLEENLDAARIADRERLGEDLRKLYVALTRARYATWIGVAATKTLNQSAISYLLNGEEPMDLGNLETHLTQTLGRSSHITIEPAPVPATPKRRVHADSPAAIGRARRMTRAVNERWWIASYSHLKAKDASVLPDPEKANDDASNEMLTDEEFAAGTPAAPTSRAAQAPVGTPSVGPLHTLPRGADVGNILHDLLEHAAAEGFGEVAADAGRIHDMVTDRCRASRLSGAIDTVAAWLQHLLLLPLPLPPMNGTAVAPVSLADLRTVICEMEFWIAADQVAVDQLDALVCKHIAPGHTRPSLPTTQINGMLKGFIDLMFEHEDRYYVLDYKSNHLGADDAAYTRAAMQAAMLKDRYELQYVLYTFALHRLLKSRLPDYDYDVHVGGISYVFLRGTHGPEQGVYTDRPPRALIEAIDTLFSQATAEASV